MSSPGGPVEQAGKIATSVVDAMRGSPMLLAMIVFNLTFVIIIYLAIVENRKNIYGIQNTIIAEMSKDDERMHMLLTTCLQTKGEFDLGPFEKRAEQEH